MTETELDEFLSAIDDVIGSVEELKGDYKPNKEAEKLIDKIVDMLNELQSIEQTVTKDVD
jgi:hypothetical protein